MAEDVLLVKKYANRRLYDTELSRYITLDELATTVRAGRRVRVIDARTEQDLTRAVLLQIILEEPERLGILPAELLHHLIRVQGTVQQAPLTTFLKGSFGQWMDAGQRWTAAATQGAEPLTRAFDPFGAGKAFVDGIQQATRGFAPFGAAGTSHAPEPPQEEAAPEEPVAAKGPPDAEELAAVRKQMEELLKRLGG